MKVLFVDHVEADYLSAITYLGLCQELGSYNVVDWPWKHSYHGQDYVGPIPYDPPGSIGRTTPFAWMPAQPGRQWCDDEVFNRIDEFDLVVLASPRAYGVDALAKLISRVGRGALRRLVMVDGEDYTAFRWDMIEQFRPSVYFKLSMSVKPYEVYHAAKARMQGLVRLVSFPLANPLGDVEPVDKDIDVVFFGGTNWRAYRREGEPTGPVESPALRARLASEFPNFKGGHLPYSEYTAAVNRAKIAVCVGGSGLEPLRTYEILGCPGTLMVRENIETVTPYPFVDGVNCAAFDGTNHDDAVRVIRKYLDDEPARSRIAAAGNHHLKLHYTPRSRARQLLEESWR